MVNRNNVGKSYARRQNPQSVDRIRGEVNRDEVGLLNHDYNSIQEGGRGRGDGDGGRGRREGGGLHENRVGREVGLEVNGEWHRGIRFHIVLFENINK